MRCRIHCTIRYTRRCSCKHSTQPPISCTELASQNVFHCRTEFGYSGVMPTTPVETIKVKLSAKNFPFVFRKAMAQPSTADALDPILPIGPMASAPRHTATVTFYANHDRITIIIRHCHTQGDGHHGHRRIINPDLRKKCRSVVRH